MRSSWGGRFGRFVHNNVEATQRLLDGYGAAPEALSWHLSAAILARAAHPFYRQLPRWAERVEAMVGAAEAARA